MSLSLTDILGGSLLDSIKGLIGQFKASPEDKLRLQELLDTNANALALKQLDLQSKLQDAVSSEMAASADVIKAEAQSQSWLPRNVRPLLLLIWGIAITWNAVEPTVGQLFHLALQPVVLDPWVYKLTAIGFTGYVTARTWEKVKDADN